MDKLLGMLGLAKRAGKVSVGTKGATDCIRSEKAKIALLASDAAANADKRITDACTTHGIPLYKLTGHTKEMLGRALGQSEAVALALTDANFAKAITKLITTNETTNEAGTSDPREVQ